MQLTEQEKQVVRQLADWNKTDQVRSEAEAIYRKNIKEHNLSGRKSNEMNFLSEFFNPFKDYTMLRFYREKVLSH